LLQRFQIFYEQIVRFETISAQGKSHRNSEW
jgi:hypothetical protein